MIKVIFFDIGSTLWDDYPAIIDMWQRGADILTKRGFPTTLEDMKEDSKRVIASFSPSLTRAILWNRLDGDRSAYDDVMSEIVEGSFSSFDNPEKFKQLNPLFPETLSVLEELSGKYRLGVISQHFSQVRQWMEYYGIAGYFEYMAISADLKLFKPDTRLFEAASRGMSVDPRESCMVGDRLDNDIFPANRLGMTTIRILKGPYVIQRERYHRDAPDYTIESIGELPGILSKLQ